MIKDRMFLMGKGILDTRARGDSKIRPQMMHSAFKRNLQQYKMLFCFFEKAAAEYELTKCKCLVV